VSRVVLGVKLVLWRRADGAAVAALDRCLHRNALLSEGKLFGDCLACPYHGWVYRPDGALDHVPSLAPGESPPALRLRTHPTREAAGLVWVWVGPLDPAARPERQPFPMPHWDEPGWGAYYMTTRFQNGVTHLVENFMDVPHTVFVHEGWFRRAARKRVPITVERTPTSVLVTYDDAGDRIGWSDRILNPGRLPLVHTDKFYLPNTTRVDYLWGEGGAVARAFVITSTCTPITPFETEVFTLISYKLGWLNPLTLGWLPAYTRKVITQDVEIMRNQGASLQHHGDPEFHGTAADLLHEDIEALRAWAEDPSRPAPPPRVRRADIWV
jgi:phenylpropionate dioxygenase-like ring-hydroxylating dioxygenase large terminal subunit